jgi:hypothetical protein
MTRFIYAIDPGTTESALVVYDLLHKRVTQHETIANEVVLDRLGWLSRQALGALLVVEQIESFGMAVGRETFETVWWAGRFHQAFTIGPRARLTRREVKLHLCGTSKAKDANIRQAILDRFGGSSAIGLKKSPGPLYGVKGHEFAALAVALTFVDTVLAKESHAVPALV